MKGSKGSKSSKNGGKTDQVKYFEMPVIKATNKSLKGYGWLVDEFESSKIEITRWPKQGWREIDEGTGDEGGHTEGLFEAYWKGDVLYGMNHAVQHKAGTPYEFEGGKYLLAYGTNPDKAKENHAKTPEKCILWHINYHPDGG